MKKDATKSHPQGIRYHIVACLFLLFAAGLFRLPFVSTLPRGLNWDEVAYGYNAYSLLKTGKDEWGRPWPLFIKSFGEYKPALFSYLLIPALLTFHDWNFALRFVPAVLGTLSVVASYGVFFQLTKSAKFSFLAALMMAIMPWHIHYSRAAMDPIVSYPFFIFGLWLWMKNSWKLRILAALSLIISMYTYNTERLFVPLLLLLHGWLFIKPQWKELSRKSLIPFALMAVGTVAIFWETLFGVGGVRARSVTIFNSQELAQKFYDQTARQVKYHVPIIHFLDSKNYFFAMNYLLRYFSHFRPDFLFFEGGNLSSQHGFMHYGNLLLIMLPFFVVGVVVGIRQLSAIQKFFFGWIVLSPLASAITIDTPHAGRTLVMVPAMCYFVALGIYSTLQWNGWKKRSMWKKAFAAFIFGLFLLNIYLYVRDYYLFFPEESYRAWQGYYTELSAYVGQNSNTYNKIYLSDYYDNPMIFYEWYNRIDPQLVQNAKRDVYAVDSFGKFAVYHRNSPLKWCPFAEPNSLVVVDPSLASNFSTAPQKTFYFYDRFATDTQQSFLAYSSSNLILKDKITARQNCDLEKRMATASATLR